MAGPNWNLALQQTGREALDYTAAFEMGRAATEKQNAVNAQRVSRARASEQLATGDTSGAQQTAMAGGDFDYAKAIGSFSEDQRKQLDAEADTLGRFAYGIKSLPKEQREQAFMQAVPALRGRFSPEEIKQRYDELKGAGWSDETLNGYVSQAMSVKDAIAAAKGPEQTALQRNYEYLQGIGRNDAAESYLGRETTPMQLVTVTNPDGSQDIVPVSKGGGPISSGGGSRGERNGNPGNIKDGPWARSQPGYVGSDGTFARFEAGAGEIAQERLLQERYLARGFNTPTAIVNRYAPPGENSNASVANYVKYIADRLGIGPNDPVPAGRVRDLAAAMREFETGNRAGGSSGGGVRIKPAPGRWRTLSAEEAAQRGLPAGPVYQEGPDGEVKSVTGTAGAAGSSGLTKTQEGVARAKVQTLRSIESQISRVERALTAVEQGGNTGFVMGRIPGALDRESDVFDKSVAGLAPLIRQLTRVPGEGAMSDYESRLAEAVLPSRTDTPEGRKEAISALRELIRNTRTGYEELLGGGGSPTPARTKSGASVSNW